MDTLGDAYRQCRRLHARYGRTYYLATALLPAWKRPHVHALYAFARYTDEIVDVPGDDSATRTRRLDDWSARFSAAMAGAPADHPVLLAVRYTIKTFDLDPVDFDKFLRSMAMDLTVTGYRTYPDLLEYMDGSAAAIGTMMLPVLEPTDRTAAYEPARQLGIAFQLTNFIRDIAEDLDRGRLYLPEEDLARFGLTRADLATPAGSQRPQAVRELLRYEIERARAHYAAARPGLDLLAPDSRPCIQVAYTLYREILDEIERAGYDVFSRRAVVPVRRRVAVAGRAAAVVATRRLAGWRGSARSVADPLPGEAG